MEEENIAFISGFEARKTFYTNFSAIPELYIHETNTVTHNYWRPSRELLIIYILYDFFIIMLSLL